MKIPVIIKKIFFRIGALIIGIIVALLLAEFMVRVLRLEDHAQEVHLARNPEGQIVGIDPVGEGFRFQVSSNRRLVYEPRNPPVLPEDKPLSELRILFLGDSIIDNIWQHSRTTFPSVLSRLVNKNPLPPWKICLVINAGVTGYNAIQSYEWYKQQWRTGQFDFVIFAYCCVNDRTENRQLADIEGRLHCVNVREYLPYFVGFPGQSYLLRFSALFRLLNSRLAPWLSRYGLRVKELNRDLTSGTREAVLGLRDLSESDGTHFFLVVIPDLLPEEREYGWIMNLVRSAGIDYVDLRPAFEEVGYKQIMINPDDSWEHVHPNQYGHEIAAELVSKKIRKIISDSPAGRERAKLVSAHEKVIVCLGDSTTAQGGAYAYPMWLEDILEKSNPEIDFMVVNRGKSGSNSGEMVALLEESLDVYQPDIVIAMMGINDGLAVEFKKITETSPTVEDACYRLVAWYRRADWFEDIVEIYKMLLEWKPGRGRIYIKLGACYRKLEKYGKSLEMIKKALNVNPRDSRAYIEWGNWFREQKKWSEAQRMYEKALELNPAVEDAYIEWGLSCRAQAKSEREKEKFQKAIRINPRSDRAYMEMGKCYEEKEDYRNAEVAYKKMLEYSPEGVGAYIELGNFYKRKGEFENAEHLYQKAIELNPGEPEPYFDLGTLYRILGRSEEAEKAYARAIPVEVKPAKGIAYIELGDFYRKRGRWLEAEEMYKKEVELNPENDRAWGALSLCYGQEGKRELSEKYLKQMDELRSRFYTQVTSKHYRELKEKLDRKGIKLLCVQYPLQSMRPLKEILKKREGIILVDNEKIFKEAVEEEGYDAYFIDNFAGNFGHCTPEGNRLLAENIAKAILDRVRAGSSGNGSSVAAGRVD